jgi:hypothetical protein
VVLADQVDDHPATIALLDVRHGERGDLGAAPATAEQHRQDGAIPHAFARADVGRVEQALYVGLGEAPLNL